MKRKRTGIFDICMLLSIVLSPASLFGSNPVITDPNADVADPEIACFNGRFYIYPTYVPSKDWESTYFKAYSSSDLVTWRDEGRIIGVSDVSWATGKCWAPCIQLKGSTYYYYFCMNQSIGVATSTSPTGPFKDALGKPLVPPASGMQSIDPDVFMDDDGQAYLYYGQGKCMVARLNANMIALDGSAQDITPSGYNEASYVIKRNGVYYLMWSENDTRDVNYQVAYATGSSPMGPFTKRGVILSKNGVFNGPGHHSVLNNPGTDDWYIAYHRHYVPGGGGQWREVCIDRMYFNSDGTIQTVIPTTAGVPATNPGIPGSTPVASTPAPTAVPGSNLAQGKTATSSSAESANPASNGNDGSSSTRWCASSGNTNEWWAVDLGGIYSIANTSVTWEFTGKVYRYKIEVSTDNANWILVSDKTTNTNTDQTQTDTFNPVSARYVRITITGLDTSVWASIYEFAVYGGTGATPAPAGIKGDVNSSGSIDIVDALLIAQYYVGLNPSGFVQANADTNCSGGIDIVDALLVAQYYVGLMSSFPC